jgi:hypothetical protein
MSFDVAYFLFCCVYPWLELSVIILVALVFTLPVLCCLAFAWMLVLEIPAVDFDAEIDTKVIFIYKFAKGHPLSCSPLIYTNFSCCALFLSIFFVSATVCVLFLWIFLVNTIVQYKRSCAIARLPIRRLSFSRYNAV